MLIALEDPGCDTLKARVLRVFDGDVFLCRIELPNRERDAELSIRCGFIDAPEMDQQGGPEARDFLQNIIGGREIELSVLTKMDTGGIVDRHGRIVAVPYVRHADRHRTNGLRRMVPSARTIFRNVELEMVLNGWAWVLERYCPDRVYMDALEDARRNRRGIWRRGNNQHPWDFKTARYRGNSSTTAITNQRSFFDEPEEREACPVPDCDGKLVARFGRYGPFFGCSSFPRCRYSLSQ